MLRANRYIKDVLSGKQVVGKLVKKAVERHVQDLKDAEKKGLYFDEAEAGAWINFSSLCYPWKGEVAKENKPFELEDWQCFLIAVLFGWKREDGSRRFRTAYVEVARKNGKTSLMAILSGGHLVLDEEAGAQIYCFANKEDQAGILVNDIGNIIGRSPDLKDRFSLFKNRNQVRRVVDTTTNSFVAALGSDSKTQDGLDPSFAIGDEVHEFKDDSMVSVIETGMGSRRQPMFCLITTAGFNKNGYCFGVRKVVMDIIEGIKEDDSVFGLIYTLDEGDDWKDEKNWIKSNPNLGASVRLDYLKDQFQKALNESGQREVGFKTKNLNQWVDAADVWIQDEKWMANFHESDESRLKNLESYGGLDLASTDDTNAFCLCIPDGEITHFKLWVWIPSEKAKSRGFRLDNSNYTKWIQDGWINVSGEEIADHSIIAHEIGEIVKEYNVKSIAYDPHLFNSKFIQSWEGDIEIFNPFKQNITTFSGPTKEFYKMAIEGKLNHFNNPVFRWMIRNSVTIEDTNENIRIAKNKSSDKVDGVIAAIESLGEKMSFEDNDSNYNEDDIYIF